MNVVPWGCAGSYGRRMVDQQHTSHVAWVRAALRDELELTDEGGTVALDRDDLDALASTAVREVLNWLVAAGKNGMVEVSPSAASFDEGHEDSA